jgi:hypothetical protein
MEPKQKAVTAYVYPMARGVVCSVHLGEVYVKNGQEVDPDTRLARFYTREEARKMGGLFDHQHLEVRKEFDDYGCASWLTMTRTGLYEYFTDLAAFIGQHVGKNN